MKETPSQARLNELLSYDPDTGDLRWKVDRGGKAKSGDLIRPRCQMKVCGETHIMARVIWKLVTGRDSNVYIDHVNRNPNDNRWSNLREATHGQNARNCSTRKDSPLGIKGVYVYQHDKSRFIATVRCRGKSHHVGVFDTLEEATVARQKKAKELHGECYCD